MKITNDKIIQALAERPELAVADFKLDYPGITDEEALYLATCFSGIFKRPGDTRQDLEDRREVYGAALEAMNRKYPIPESVDA